MRRRILPPAVLLAAVALLQPLVAGIDQTAPYPVQAEFPSFVFRAEYGRTPLDVAEDGGMRALGIEKILNQEKLSDEQTEKGSRLVTHANGGPWKNYTRYISTSSSAAAVREFAISDDERYLYVIKTDAKFVDMRASTDNAIMFPYQNEHAAVGFIPHDQILGNFNMSKLGKNPLQKYSALEKLDESLQSIGTEKMQMQFFRTSKSFDRNEKYNENKYRGLFGSGAQRQLAGFDENSKAWKAKWLKKYKGQKVSLLLDQFVRDKITGARGGKGESVWEWTKRSPRRQVPPRVRPIGVRPPRRKLPGDGPLSDGKASGLYREDENEPPRKKRKGGERGDGGQESRQVQPKHRTYPSKDGNANQQSHQQSQGDVSLPTRKRIKAGERVEKGRGSPRARPSRTKNSDRDAKSANRANRQGLGDGNEAPQKNTKGDKRGQDRHVSPRLRSHGRATVAGSADGVQRAKGGDGKESRPPRKAAKGGKRGSEKGSTATGDGSGRAGANSNRKTPAPGKIGVDGDGGAAPNGGQRIGEGFGDKVEGKTR